MSAPFRFPKFFVTNPSPCPYLPGKVERKVFTELTGRHSSELNEALGRIGFRRSQSVAYRPSCIDCSACVSVRVLAAEFEARQFDPRNAPMYSQMLVGMVALTGQWWLENPKAKKRDVAAALVNLAWNGLTGLEAKPQITHL